MTTETKAETCRCGWTGDGPHPCHGAGYSCRNPAQRRLYVAKPVPLAGMHLKFGVSETWACDECWSAFQK